MTKDSIKALAEKEYPISKTPFILSGVTNNDVINDCQKAFEKGTSLVVEENKLVKVLQDMAKQRTYSECIADTEFGGGDFEGAYDHFVSIAREAIASLELKPPASEPDWKDAQRNKVQLSNVQLQDGIQLEWLKIWEQIEIWYGDIKKKETGRDFLLRMQSEYPVIATPAPASESREQIKTPEDVLARIRNTMFMTGGNTDAEKDLYERGALFGFSLSFLVASESREGDAGYVEDLQDQVRKQIKEHGLFDWHEALTENEMLYLENLLLTFCPIFPKGSIGYDKQNKPQPVKPREAGVWVKDTIAAIREQAILTGWEHAVEFVLSKENKQL